MVDNIIALIGLTAVLVLIPGPNVALIVANSLKNGTWFGLITVAGTTLGVAVQLLFVVSGLQALLNVAVEILEWVKWVGAVYLIYIGILSFREKSTDLLAVSALKADTRRVFFRGAILAVLNPKTLIFNAAFLPQFISVEASSDWHVFGIAAVFLTVLSVGDSLWAICAGYARSYIRQFNHFASKVSGIFMIMAGVGLALANGEKINASN